MEKLYFKISHSKTGTSIEYTVALSNNKEPTNSTIAVKRVPTHLISQLTPYFEENKKSQPTPNHVVIGQIAYAIYEDPKTAYPRLVYPTRYLDLDKKTQIKGVGSYIEAITTNHLRNQGIIRIDSSSDLSDSRRNQLEKAFGEKTLRYTKPVKGWLQGIGRRISDGRKKSKEE
ncbi:hypothetical protein HUU53_04545 [Candidatus Micrarchaeota archaeon]|nr:hypothetical protein [Candidatus Micrarchaeota archaeon]